MADIAKICGVSIDDIAKINGLAIDDISKFCGLAVPAGGEWKPTDITGCVLWVDASQVAGLNDGDTLSSWDNLTGGADLAANGFPKYKTNIQNGLPAILFDPKGPYLTASSAMNFRSVFAVSKYTNVAFESYDGLVGGVSTAGLVGDSGKITWFLAESGNYRWNGVTSTKGPINAFAQNTLIYAATKSDTPTVGNDRAYTGRAWHGYICEVIYYDTALSSDDYQVVEDYLMTKWGIS